MAKKTQKANKSIVKRNGKQVSFNNQFFILGGNKVFTGYLSFYVKRFILEIYKKKQLGNSNLYKQNAQDSRYKDKQFKSIVLIDSEAIKIIEHFFLRSRGVLTQHNYFSYRISQLNHKAICNQQASLSGQIKIWFNSIQQVTKNINQQTQSLHQSAHRLQNLLQSRKKLKKLKIQQTLKNIILNLQKQIFYDSIAMIIEQKSVQNLQREENQKQQDQENTTCILIFQQSYPSKQLPKKHLLEIIGRQNYDRKIIHTLSIYQQSLNNQNFNNPYYRVCHDSMKLIMNVDYPQNLMECTNKVNEQHKNIKSIFNYTPYEYLSKIISKNHFQTINTPFSHPFISYYQSNWSNSVSSNIGLLSCDRIWCGQCFLLNKKQMNFSCCQFCQRLCKCFRCKKFNKLIQLEAHYLQMNGQIQTIQSESVWFQIFGSNKYEIALAKKDKKHIGQFKYLKQLKRMFNEKHQILKSYKINLQKRDFNQVGDLITQIRQNQKKSGLYHEDSRNNKKIRINRNDKCQNNYKRYLHGKKQEQIDIKISRLSKQKVKSFHQSYIQQFNLLSNRLKQAKIFKTTNPTLNKFKKKTQEVIIKSQSKIKKISRIFINQVQQNTIMGIKSLGQQRKIFKVNRNNYLVPIKENSFQFDNNAKGSILSELHKQFEEKKLGSYDQVQKYANREKNTQILQNEKEEINKNSMYYENKEPQNQYGSIWQ